MNSKDEKLDRWLNAYLDGALSAEDAARFESVAERDPQVRAKIDMFLEIETSLSRLFAPPAEAPAIQDAPSEPIAVIGHRPRRAWRGLAIAAMVLLSIGGGWWGWQNYIATNGTHDAPQWYTMAEFYEKSRKDDFKEDWLCDSEREFQTTFWYRVGTGVTLAQGPPGVSMQGLKYGPTLSAMTVHVMGRVNGEGVIVFVDRKNRDKAALPTGKLHTFRKETEHLVMYEVSPLDKPYMLDLLSETELPDEWKRDMHIPMNKPG